MTSRSLLPAAPLPLVAVVLSASGCMTQALWEIEPESRLVVVAQHRVEAAVEVLAGVGAGAELLLDARRTGDESLPMASGFASARSFWRLEQAWSARGRGAAEARAVLERAGDFEVEHIDVRIRRDLVDGSVDCRAELEVTARTGRPLCAVALEASALSPAARAALLRIGDGDLLFDHAPPADRGDVLVECARRLRALDPSLWLPRDRGRPARFVGCVWLDVDGLPLDDDRRARLLRDLAMADRPGSHLAMLAGLQLLAVVAGSAGTELFALEPDRVWILGSLDLEGDRVRHRSEWLAWPVAAPAGDGLTVVGSGTMRLDYLGGRIEYDVVPNVAMKILLTPVTVAADSVLHVLESWLVCHAERHGRREPPRRWD